MIGMLEPRGVVPGKRGKVPGTVSLVLGGEGMSDFIKVLPAPFPTSRIPEQRCSGMTVQVRKRLRS